MSNPIKKIAVLISGSGSNLQALIDFQPQSHYQIDLVISNRPDVLGLKRAQEANIPTRCLDHKTFESREAFDAEMIKIIDDAKIDFIVLAGFMRILTPAFTEHYLGKMLNIHPSLLPKYSGLNTHQRAIDAADAEHGVSVHFVTPELDGGPVVLQAKVTIDPQDSPNSLQKKVHLKEHLIYPIAIEWLATEQLTFSACHAFFKGKRLMTPLIFTPLEGE